jgi:hydrogenase maturation protease
MPKTLVLGLGNPIVSDDGVGIYAAREIFKIIKVNEDVVVKEASIAGFDLIDLLSGYERVIIIDAIKTGKMPPGYIFELTPEDMATTVRLAYIHEIDLPMALELGKKLNIPMPEEVIILAVEVEDMSTFSEELTSKVGEALPLVVKMALNICRDNPINKWFQK